jgi:hypothetical protein
MPVGVAMRYDDRVEYHDHLVNSQHLLLEPEIAPEGNGRKEALGLGFRPPNPYGL